MKLTDNFKKFLGVDDDDDDLDEYEDEDLEEIEEKKESKSFFKPSKANVVDYAGSKKPSSAMMIKVHEPLGYEEAPAIIDDLKIGKAVVVNFEQLENSLKKQLFDFINGGVYSIDGKIQKVTRDIFIIAPKNVGIDGVKDEMKNRGIFPY